MAEGFQKIELQASNKRPKLSNADNKSSKVRVFKLFRTFFFAFLLTTIILVLVLIYPIRNLYISIQKTVLIAQESYTSAKNQDLEKTQANIKKLKENLLQVDKNLSGILWLKYFPILGSYIRDADRVVNGSIYGIEAGEIAVETLVPYADLLGMRGKSTFVSGSADERIKTAVETLDKITPNIDKIAEKITLMETELTQIDPKKYPERVGSVVVRPRLISAKELFAGTAELFVDARPFLKKLPQVLGSKESRTYLVLFQNDAELRATGGFITDYALFKLDKGKMQAIKSDDIYKLDEAKRKKFEAPAPIAKYHKNVSYFELRDSNLSPDFVTSMKQFKSMLEESVADFPKFDGIIAVDTHVLVETVRILGDFNVYGRVFSAENDKRCDCPKVIYELEDYATRPVAYVREERKDIIGVLIYQIMQKALGVSPSQYWGRLFQMFLTQAQQKHVLIYLADDEAQKGIDALNFAGSILPYEGDYLHINDVNFAGAKSNLFVTVTVKQELTLADDGTLTKTLTINYKNPTPPSNCNLEAGQLCLNGILRNWLRIYAPKGATLTEFTGSEKDTVTYEELGKTVFEGFLTVKPQGASEVKVGYKLLNKLKKGDIYKLLIQKQPGTNDIEHSVFFKGKEVEKFPLLTDKEISIKL